MKRYPLILIWFGLWIVAPLALIRMAWAILTNPERAWRIALSYLSINSPNWHWNRLGHRRC